MKHGKKHKEKKSSKSSKKSKKSDRKEKKLKKKEKLKRDKKLAKALKTVKEAPISNDKDCSKIDPVGEVDEFCGPSIGMDAIWNWIEVCTKPFHVNVIRLFSADLMNRAKCPETKAEYDHRQSQIKRVVDPETGRIR